MLALDQVSTHCRILENQLAIFAILFSFCKKYVLDMPAIGQVIPTSHYEVLHQLQQGVLEDIQSGKYRPFLYPYCAFGVNILVLYFLIPPTKSQYVYNIRYAIFPIICLNALDQILHCRSTWITLNYGNGLINSFLVLWSVCMLFVHDGRADVKRIEAVATVKQKDKATAEDGAATNSKANDRAYEARTSRSDDPRTENRQISSPASKPSATDEPKPNPTYKWQSLPPHSSTASTGSPNFSPPSATPAGPSPSPASLRPHRK